MCTYDADTCPCFIRPIATSSYSTFSLFVNYYLLVLIIYTHRMLLNVLHKPTGGGGGNLRHSDLMQTDHLKSGERRGED